MEGIEVIYETDMPHHAVAHRQHIYDRIYEAAHQLRKMPSGALKVDIGDIKPKTAQAKAHVAFRFEPRWRLRTTVDSGFLYMRKIPIASERIHQETLRRSQPPNAIQDNRIANNTEHNQ